MGLAPDRWCIKDDPGGWTVFWRPSPTPLMRLLMPMAWLLPAWLRSMSGVIAAIMLPTLMSGFITRVLVDDGSYVPYGVAVVLLVMSSMFVGRLWAEVIASSEQCVDIRAGQVHAGQGMFSLDCLESLRLSEESVPQGHATLVFTGIHTSKAYLVHPPGLSVSQAQGLLQSIRARVHPGCPSGSEERHAEPGVGADSR